MRRGRVVAAVAVVALVSTGLSVSLVRVNAAPPLPVATFSIPPTLTPAPGPPKPVLQPPQGSLALQGNGRDIALLDADDPRPIASVAKAMTALVVLQAHPLADRYDEGPVLTMDAADVQFYRDTVAEDGSYVPIALGERLTERQMMLALLLPSANNFADSLGRWVAGSVPAFVDRLNATAAAMGMAHTHFDDPSGFSLRTVSTASDLVILGHAVLRDRALTAIVGTAHARLPDGTQLDNLDTLLDSVPGWLGIKTGSTPEAGGCLLFAARRSLGPGADVEMVGAVLAQTDLHAALDAARSAVLTGFEGYAVVDGRVMVPPVTGDVRTAWGWRSLVHAASSVQTLAVRAGTVLQLRLVRRTVTVPMARGRPVAEVVASVDGRDVLTWPVVLDLEVARPSGWWMLLHG